MRTRYLRSSVASVLAIAMLPITPARSALPAQLLTSPPGQVKVVTINAHQNRILGLNRFTALFELGRALRRRPLSFDGGFEGGVSAPDVLIVQEMKPSNLEIFQRLLRQRFKVKYSIVGAADTAAAIIANEETVTQNGDVVRWPDVCTDPDNPPDDRAVRDYELARFNENTTGVPFTIVGMHLAKDYSVTGQTDCGLRNMREMRSQIAQETAPVIIGGDFNKRAMETQLECDPNEESPAQQWWLEITQPADGGKAYQDAVRTWHRSHGESISHEWTHEQKTSTAVCDGSTKFRRSRIDYLFSDAPVAEAHADHPGWAGSEPGSHHPSNYKYSDHRFVWGRFVLTPTPPAQPVSLTADSGGVIHVSWAPVEGAIGYVLYRGFKNRDYDTLQTFTSATTGFDDRFTEHDISYRYSVAAIGPDGGQGLEAGGRRATADARGPRVIHILPRDGASGVEIHTNVRVRFDEPVDPASVDNLDIKIFRGDNRLAGRVRQDSRRLLILNPNRALRKGQNYRVVVGTGLKDKLGNRSVRFVWHFVTEEPPPKKHRRGR